MADPLVVGSEIKALTGANNVKMIGAYRLSGSTGTPYVMVNSADGTYYQVPVGRKCIIIELAVVGGATGYGNNTVYIGSTANSTTGAHTALMCYNCSSDNVGSSPPVKTYIEMAAGDYCNIDVIRNPTMVTMIGIEMDA